MSAGMHVHVMSVPERADSVAEFQQQWDGETTVWQDDDHRGVLFNHTRIIRAMLTTEPTFRDWHVIVQDDVEPVDDARQELAGALMFCPRDVPFLSLSHFGDRTASLVRRGIPYGVGLRTMWGQGTAYRTEVLEEYLQLLVDADRWGPAKVQNWDDGMVSAFNIMHGTRSAVTARAVFIHKHMRSTLGHLSAIHRVPAVRADEHRDPAWMSTPRSAPFGPRKSEQQHLDLVSLIEQRRADV